MVIFGCGVVTGGLLMKTELPAVTTVVSPEVAPRAGNTNNVPPPWAQVQRPEFLKRIKKALNLTPEQSDQIAKIMKDSQDRSRPLWDIIAPQMRKEVRRVREEIRAVLTPDQQEKFDELLKRPRRQNQGATNGPPEETPAPTNAT
jgi:Spy/CpxP family protein refolding chaperone